MKNVSVVVSTYSKERSRYVMSCIASLKKQELLPWEIILVLDPDEVLIEFYKSCVPKDVKIVVSENYGLSNARNCGVKVAECEVIAFVDDDAIADKNWLRNLVKNYYDSNVMVVGGIVKPIWEDGRPSWFPEELDWIVGCSYKGLPERRCFVRNPIGCNMSFLKDVFDKIGYFKTNIGRSGKKLLDAEEMELSARVLQEIPSSKVIYDPSAVVYHEVPKSRTNFSYLVIRSFYQGYSKALVTNLGSLKSISLSTENRYLRYLVINALLPRQRRSFSRRSLGQIVALLLSTLSVFIGYFFGKTINKMH